eukprot:scaffold7845_cov444-Prasinococcus_capsulatus_cf.AAC.1
MAILLSQHGTSQPVHASDERPQPHCACRRVPTLGPVNCGLGAFTVTVVRWGVPTATPVWGT